LIGENGRAACRLLSALAIAVCLGLSSLPASGKPTEQFGVKTVRVTNYRFRPSVTELVRGDSVRWRFIEGTHGVRDSTKGLKLFGTRNPRSPGSDYVHTYSVAGTYSYVCTVHPWRMSGLIRVGMVARLRGRGALITWASARIPKEYVVDVLILRPGSQQWRRWQWGTTQTGARFTPDAGKGEYRFRARLRRSRNGGVSKWSPKLVLDLNRGPKSAE
jgi:plastocyanin